MHEYSKKTGSPYRAIGFFSASVHKYNVYSKMCMLPRSKQGGASSYCPIFTFTIFVQIIVDQYSDPVFLPGSGSGFQRREKGDIIFVLFSPLG